MSALVAIIVNAGLLRFDGVRREKSRLTTLLRNCKGMAKYHRVRRVEMGTGSEIRPEVQSVRLERLENRIESEKIQARYGENPKTIRNFNSAFA